MAKFNFRFQKILDLKENEKEVAKIDMANAIKEEEKEHQRNQAIYQKIIEVNHLKNEKQNQGVPIAELRMLEKYLDELNEQLKESNQELNHLRSKVAKRKNYLLLKTKEEKTWINLKEEQREIFEQEVKLEEQKFLDELASLRYYHSTIAERG